MPFLNGDVKLEYDIATTFSLIVENADMQKWVVNLGHGKEMKMWEAIHYHQDGKSFPWDFFSPISLVPILNAAQRDPRIIEAGLQQFTLDYLDWITRNTADVVIAEKTQDGRELAHSVKG